jgi:hypothetical protein
MGYPFLRPLVGKLSALGDDLQYVVLQGTGHDESITVGWPYAKDFFEDELPPN